MKEFFDYLFDGAVNNGEFPLIEYRTLSTMLRLILICAGKLKPSSICFVGLDGLSLSVNGDLYACGTAENEKEFRLAHVTQISNYDDVRKYYSAFYEKQLKNILLPCRSCMKTRF
ncbi:MAG: hypothetical protein QXE05_09010 [Nitrososphaeria archaeon]